MRAVLSSLGTLAVACSVLLVGCDKPKPPVADDRPAEVTPWTAMAAAPRSAAPAPRSAVPAPPSAAPASGSRGAVVETMRSGGYTYARVAVGGEEVWVAGPETTLAIGDAVDVAAGQLMTGFRSNTLDRTFDRIYFLSAWSGAPTAGAPSPHADVAAARAPDLAPGERIPPAEGGQTVEQVLVGKAALGGRPVVVRGKVVKVNTGIMGKNWLHLQDGTGAAGTNDLTVTTADVAVVGDVIVARGTLALDKDFGAGYRYAALLEDATLERR
jgi:hypothetical protein